MYRRVAPGFHEQLAINQACLIIQVEQCNSGTTAWRAPDDPRADQLKMVPPALCTGIEEPYDHTLYRINRRQIRTLALITLNAREGKVIVYGRTTMLQRNQVVKVMHASANRLWNQTIFTAGIGALNHQTAERVRNVGAWHDPQAVGSAKAARRKHGLATE